MAGPSTRTAPPTSPWQERGIADEAKLAAAKGEEAQGLMPDGAVVIIAAIWLHQHLNPRNVIAAACWQTPTRWAWCKPWVKTSFAPGSKGRQMYLEEAGLLAELEKLGFGIVAFACTTCNGMSGALDPEKSAEGNHRPRPVRHRRAVGQPQL